MRHRPFTRVECRRCRKFITQGHRDPQWHWAARVYLCRPCYEQGMDRLWQNLLRDLDPLPVWRW